MNDRQSIYYYLGANSADGFYSLYDNLVSYDKGDFLWVIKGGAGCGKSSFMRIIASAAQRAGHAVEYVSCSGDPDSLDAIYIPELKTAYMDGTAPHVTDIKLAAVNSNYLNLGVFYKLPGLAKSNSELLSVSAEISLQYKKAYANLAAAGALRRGWLPTIAMQGDIDSASKRMDGIIRRELGTRHRLGGSITKRFLSALTCQGVHSHPSTAQSLCSKCYILNSRLGLSPAMLDKLAISACDSGFEVILCPDPLTPELPEAVFIPAASLSFIASTSPLASFNPARHIHLDPKGENATQKLNKREIMRYDKMFAALLTEAFAALSEAKALHDRLERIYNPHVDFDGVHSLAGEHLKMLGLT